MIFLSTYGFSRASALPPGASWKHLRPKCTNMIEKPALPPLTTIFEFDWEDRQVRLGVVVVVGVGAVAEGA